MPARHRFRGVPHRRRCCNSVLLVLLVANVVATSVAAPAPACDSGVLQLKAFPQRDDSCFAAPLTVNSIKAFCGAALRVRVKNGVVKIVPLEQGTYSYEDVLPGTTSPPPFLCKDLNASGLFYPGSTTSASVMLYDNFGGPLSNLTKTGPNQVTLTPGRTYSWRGPEPDCAYNYTVTEGCVFGIKAPTKKPACPAGYYKKTGRFSKAICLPCPAGTYISKGTGGTCKPCPPGTYNSYLGAAKCQKCGLNAAAPKAGSTTCGYCESFEEAWSDGLKCIACPKGSFSSDTQRGQCFKCQAGRRCCTVGWNKDCPKCSTGKFEDSYTSIFALESAAPTSCLATGHALCAPKINITVDSSCKISLDNRENGNDPDDNTSCSWATTEPVQGAKLSISDIAKFAFYDGNHTLLSGNFTSAASPYLNVYIPATKCTIRYRALTAPIATLLGAAPKPSKATTCPAGKYLETDTDTKPGPCLLCPPGTYSPAPSSGRSCIRCAAGTYTNRYGSTKCTKCPVGRVSRAGAAWCPRCDVDSIATSDGKQCVTCPKDSNTPYSLGAGPRCLANVYGNICCAAGDCKGQTLCKGPRLSASDVDVQTYTAVFQLVSRTLPQPGCKAAQFLSCLPDNGKVQLYTYSTGNTINMEPYRTPFKCGNATSALYGGYLDTKTAWVSTYADSPAFGMVSDRSKGTVTMYPTPYISSTHYIGQVPIKVPPGCSATFKLISGYAFDLAPPKGANCDPLDSVTNFGGRQFCRPCPAGEFKNSTGLCESCKAGTYNSQVGASGCLPCAAGYSCSSGSTSQTPCGSGAFSSKPQQESCSSCPANTFNSASFGTPVTKCQPCPKGTVAPTGATACGLLWDKTFPA